MNRCVALVIGNSSYPHRALPNAGRDAQAVGDILTGLGFQTTVGVDLDHVAMAAAITNLSGASRSSHATIFYYAGHAFQIGGSVYLLPIDWKNRSDRMIPMGRLLGAMTGAAARIVILDSCREIINREVARSASPTGSLGSAVIYSTRAGGKSSDGEGDHSPFAESLMRHVGTPGQDIVGLYRAIAGDLRGIQNPEIWLSHADPLILVDLPDQSNP